MKKIAKIITFILSTLNTLLLLVALVVGGGILLLPWRDFMAQKLEQTLAQQGFENPKLRVDSFTLDTIRLKDLSLGDENPLVLKDLEILYDLNDVREGRLRHLVLSDLNFSVEQDQKGAWSVRGISFTKDKDKAENTFSIPVTRADLKIIPVDDLEIQSGHFNLMTPTYSIKSDFSVFYEDAKIDLVFGPAEMIMAGQIYAAQSIKITLVLDEEKKQWDGNWAVEGLNVKNVPLRDLNGTMTLNQKDLSISGDYKATDQSGLKASYRVQIPVKSPQSGQMTLRSAMIPYSDGVIEAGSVTFPLISKNPIKIPVKMKGISVNAIMQMMTGQYVSATGSISGEVPVIISRDGKISIGSGRLDAVNNGTITMPPELIPGEGAQLDITREILSDFHYNGLSFEVTETGKDKISVKIALKGNNPKVYDGRAVNLNVNLGGDVLDFVRSNVMMLMDPQSIFTQGEK